MDLDELQERAREALSRNAYDYYAGGAERELTLADNQAAWDRLRLRPHVLRDVSAISTRATVLGTDVSMPVLVAPTAYHRMADDAGEAATARAAAAAGTLMVVSTLATVSLEDVADAAPDAPRWFQLYLRRDRGWTTEIIKRAEAAGYEALVLTVDMPVQGLRPRDDGNRFELPEGMEMANVGQALASQGGSGLAAFASSELDASLTPDTITWVRSVTDLPVLVKGVLRGDDATACVDAGAAAVVVSNHGGRQLDTAISGCDALPEVVDAVGGAVEVYVDGGVRRGTDILKALAMGAQAVLVGRPILWGLATGGADGALEVLRYFRAEVERVMALCGCASVADIHADLVRS